MAGRMLFECLAPVSQDAKAVEMWLKAMNYPVTRPDIVQLDGERALVKSSDGRRYYVVSREWCTCAAGQRGKMCRHRKALEAVLKAKEAEKKAEERPKRQKFAPDGWD